jgi:hypothetical protein
MKTIKLNNIEVKIRRAKVKEIKEFIKDMAAKITEVANFIYQKPMTDDMTDDEFINSLPEFIIENIEFFEKYVLKFTIDFTQDNFDDLDFLDSLKLIKEIIIHNGISEDFIKSFFCNLKKTLKEQTKDEFMKEIPNIEV